MTFLPALKVSGLPLSFDGWALAGRVLISLGNSLPRATKKGPRTMKRYQAQLPERNITFKRNPHELFREMKARILETLQQGFWFCHTCESPTERNEGENGQPAHCGRCGSFRIEFVPPIRPTPAEQFAQIREEVAA